MKKTLAFVLMSSTFFSLAQVERYTEKTEFNGPIKSVITYDYIANDANYLKIGNSLSPTCEVCEHFEKFDREGKLIEKQEYIIIEPVSDLGMGYCLNLALKYEKDELVEITAKRFEFHEMEMWGHDEGSSTEETIYSIVKEGSLTTTTYIDQWEASSKKYYKNGLLIKDRYHEFFYDDQDRLIKRIPVEEASISQTRVDTWYYNKDDLLEEHTSMDTTGGYFFGSQTKYFYYPSGELLSENEYLLNGPNKTDEKELRSIRYYSEDGRDSLYRAINLYSDEKTQKNFIYEYLFHPNGGVSTKTQKTENGEICGFETFDENGNLTQKNEYNMSFEPYNISRYTYNEKNQLIEMHVVDNYNEKEYSILYEYDEYGNQTYIYEKSDYLISLVKKQIFEYYP